MIKTENTNNSELSLFQRVLKDYLESGDVLDIYRERLEREGLLGRVIQWSDHVLILDRIDEEFRYDGLSAIRPNDLTRIRANDRELRSIKKLVMHELPAGLADVALLEISAAITKLSQRYSVVTVFTEEIHSNVAFVGEPVDLDDDFLLLNAWGTARNADSYQLLLRLSSITRVDADTNYIRRLTEVRKN